MRIHFRYFSISFTNIKYSLDLTYYILKYCHSFNFVLQFIRYDGQYHFLPQKHIFAACPNVVRSHEWKKREDGWKTGAIYVSFKSGWTKKVDGALISHVLHQSALASNFKINLNLEGEKEVLCWMVCVDCS